MNDPRRISNTDRPHAVAVAHDAALGQPLALGVLGILVLLLVLILSGAGGL